MQRTLVRSLVQEEPTCHRATKPMRHSYRSLCSATREANGRETHAPPLESGPRSLQLEKAKKTQHSQNLKNKTLKNLLIYFWLHWVFIAFHQLSLVVVSAGLLFFVVQVLLTAVDSLVSEQRL